jgi:hypothetical protein
MALVRHFATNLIRKADEPKRPPPMKPQRKPPKPDTPASACEEKSPLGKAIISQPPWTIISLTGFGALLATLAKRVSAILLTVYLSSVYDHPGGRTRREECELDRGERCKPPKPKLLHDYFRSAASWRVRIALGLKAVSIPTEPHHLRRGEQGLLRIWP